MEKNYTYLARTDYGYATNLDAPLIESKGVGGSSSSGSGFTEGFVFGMIMGSSF